MTVGEGRRLLQLLGPSSGGIRRHVACLAEHLDAAGWEVSVAGPGGVMDGLGPLQHPVAVPSRLTPRRVAAARRDLRPLVGVVDLVHAHGLKAGWLAASLRRRPPLVVSVHNLVLGTGGAAPALRALEGLLVGRADAVIATSAEVARRLSGVAGADRVVVALPVGPRPQVRRDRDQVRAALGVGPGERLLLTPARLHPQKGLDTLLAAVGRLRLRVGGLRAVVLGEGPLDGELRRRRAELDLDDVVALAGWRPSIADELAAADVVVVPSRWESSPLVVVEALSLGRPVVATAVGAVPDVVVDGVSGRLVPVDDAAALATAIEELLGDPAAAAAMGLAGRRMVEARYDPHDLVDRVEAVYRDVLERA
ncbi:MAG: glycosyltransferase family 4 protein [Acidimicrobiales bacterium]